MKNRSYSEMIKYKSFGDRLEYLKLFDDKYQSPRSISNHLYKLPYWTNIVRPAIIRRDLGFDLASMNCSISGIIIVHHINPLTEEDIENWSDKLFDSENLITTSTSTHNLIHYAQEEKKVIERKPGDTILW